MGRPKKDIDAEQVENLAAILCTVEEIAAVLDCSKRTLETRFCALIEKGRQRGKASLRRAQYKVAVGGNATMLIWLGKQLLDQTDKPREIDAPQNEYTADEKLTQINRILDLAGKRANRSDSEGTDEVVADQ